MSSLNPYSNRWPRIHRSTLGLDNKWYQSKTWGTLKREQQLEFIQRKLKRENQAHIGSCMKKILEECKSMLNNKMKEVIQHNTNLNQPISNERFKNYKCFQCKQLGHIVKTCPMDYKVENTDAKKETKRRMEGIIATKPTVLITYPETIHFSTTCMIRIKDTDLTGRDEIWYVSNQINRHVCYKLDAFCNIKEEFSVTKLENQRKLLFTYGLGEILIEANGKSHIIPGVYYAPEVTLNILSLEQLEKQGFQVTYDGNRCSLSLMFKDKEIKRFDEDRLRRMHNHYMQKYFESISKEGEQDTVRIKGNLYTTKVQSFNDFVAFLNLVKLDDVVSQEWDYFRQRFNMVVKWFFNHYLKRSLPGTIPPVINGVEIRLFDLYKIMENLGGYLSVHFSQEFDMVGEIMGLSKGNGEEIKRCYMNFLEILTSHFKTARAPRQGHMDTMSEPARRDSECLGCHQWEIGEDGAQRRRPAVLKGKGIMEHFGVQLEDTNEGPETIRALMKKRMWNMLWQVPIPKSNMYAISDKLSPEDASDDYEGRLKQLVYESNHGGAAVTQRRGNRWTLPAASSSRHLGGDNPVVETGDGKRSLMGKKNTSKYTGGGMVVGVFAP
ncbi:ARID DNA-binding domain-containing protein [Tanacetum coccineum]